MTRSSSNLPPAVVQRLAREVLARLARVDRRHGPAPETEVAALCQALCAPHPYAASQMIERLLQAGVPHDRIYAQYLTEAAMRLGQQWERNRLSFRAVGLATMRIYAILGKMRSEMPPVVQGGQRKIAFAAVPGDDHVPGAELATDTFRQDGWDVEHLVGLDHDALMQALGDTHIVLLGLSASGGQVRAALWRLVVALRVERPDLKIMVSGNIVHEEPRLIRRIGVDGATSSIEDGIDLIRSLLEQG